MAGSGRMKNSGADEKPAQGNGGGVIDSQNFNRCAANRSVAGEHGPLSAEMLIPTIPARMKQPDDFMRHRIDAGQVRALVAVAIDAAQRQVFLLRRPAVLLRNDVIHLEIQPRKSLGKLAIFATEPGTPPDRFHEVPLHVRSAGRAPRAERKQRLGLHEFHQPPDVQVFIEKLPLLARHRPAARLRREFIGLMQISVSQLECQNRPRRVRTPRCILNGNRPLKNRVFGIGCCVHA